MPTPPVRVTPGTGRLLWIPSQRTSDAYLQLENTGDSDVALTGATSPDYEQVNLVTTADEEGEHVKAGLDRITIPPQSSIELRPGDDRLQLDIPTRTIRPGDEISIDLHFSDGSTVTVPLRAST